MPWTRDRKKKLRLALFLSLPLVAAGGLYFAREPFAEKTRAFRANQNLRSAQRASESAEWESAYQQALVARQLNPTAVEPLRLLASVAFNSRSPRTLDYANLLFLHERAESEDRLLALTILQEAQDHVGFVRLYNLLPAELRQERPFVVLRAKFLIARNAFDSAKDLLESEIEEERDRQFLLLLASLLVQPSATPEEMARGQEIIAELAGSGDADETARAAFQLLGFVEPDRLRPELLGDLGARAMGGATATTAEYLAAASLAMSAARSPEDRRRIVERAIAEQGGISPAQLAAWLQRIDRSEDTLEFLTPERSAESTDLYQMRFSALLQAGRLEEAGEWLSNPPPGLETINIWLARARLSRLTAERAAESAAWEQAFQVAQNTASRNEYLRIFEVASQADRVDLATRALLRAPAHPVGILPPAVDTVRPMMYLAENERLEDLHYLTEALVAREPENVHLLNNLIYLNFLLGRQISLSVDSAARLVEEHPDLLSLRTTHAMGLLLLGDAAAALATLPEEPARWRAATAADLAIRATATERAGQAESAAEIWEQVDKKQLNAAERRLLLAAPVPEEAEEAGDEGEEPPEVAGETGSGAAPADPAAPEEAEAPEAAAVRRFQ